MGRAERILLFKRELRNYPLAGDVYTQATDIEDERNGLIVKGRYGKAAWADEQTGMLRENYEAMYTPDPDVTQGLIDSVSRLVEEHELRRRIGRAGRADVEQKYTLAKWNEGLKSALDKARQELEDLRNQLQQISTNIMTAGGGS